MQGNNPVTYFAESDFRNRKLKFGIRASDRTRHVYTIGKTGMGKSTLLENMAIQDIQNGNGVAVIDPHGSFVEKLLDYVPESRIKDVVYLAPFDTEFPVAFNIMEDVGKDKRHLVANGLMSAFKKIWVDAWSARMEYILGNTILALLEYPGATLLSINKMYTDKEFRKQVIAAVTDPTVKSFWVDEFSKYTDKYAAEATPAIQNKIGQFVSNPIIRNIIGQPKSSFDIRRMMDEKKIFLINLSKGLIGEGNATLLGAMLTTKIYLSAMSRADLSAGEMAHVPNFYFFVDEFQTFVNDSFADILSEARKYKLNLTIAHQYLEQMPENVRAAVIGNVGTMIIFRVGSYDADIFEKEFAPVFTAEDIVNLSKHQIYLKLMIDGVSSKPFSATTMGPITPPEKSFRTHIITSSRDLYAKPRSDVEAFIQKSLDPTVVSRPLGETKESTSVPLERREAERRAPVIPPPPRPPMPPRAPTPPPMQHKGETKRTWEQKDKKPLSLDPEVLRAKEAALKEGDDHIDLKSLVKRAGGAEPKESDNKLSLREVILRAQQTAAPQEKKPTSNNPISEEQAGNTKTPPHEIPENVLKKLIEE